MASLLTFVGVLLKLSFDDRNLQRLRIDTSIQAVGLIGAASEPEAEQSQRAGALFALANLGELEFSLALLGHMWPNKQVVSSTAVWLVNKSLEQDDANIQVQSARILRDNAKQLKTNADEDHLWPNCFEDDWKPDLDIDAREMIFVALLLCLMTTPRSLLRFVTLLYLIRSTDQNPALKAGATLALDAILTLYEKDIELIVSKGRKKVAVDELREEVAKSVQLAESETYKAFLDLIRELRIWVKTPDAERLRVAMAE